jgi:hypothetical protein
MSPTLRLAENTPSKISQDLKVGSVTGPIVIS